MKAEQTRPLYLFGGLAVLIALVFFWLGAAYGVRMLVEAACFALIALGLTIQWGYAGLFNTGVMGFIAIAAFACLTPGTPSSPSFARLPSATGAGPRSRSASRMSPGCEAGLRIASRSLRTASVPSKPPGYAGRRSTLGPRPNPPCCGGFSNAPGRTRTSGLLLRRQLL